MPRVARSLAGFTAVVASLAVATPALADAPLRGPVVSIGAACSTAATTYGPIAQLTDGITAASPTDPAWLQLNNGATFQLSCVLPAQRRVSALEIRFQADSTRGRVAPSQVVIMTRPDASTAWSRVAVVPRPAAVDGVVTFAATTDRVVGQVGYLIVAPGSVWSDELSVYGWPETA